MALALVTGASGFVGSHLCEALSRRGHQLRLLMRKTSSAVNLSLVQDYEIAIGDLEDKDSLKRAVEGVDYIFHLGGIVASIEEERFFSINGAGTKALAKAAEAHSPALKRFIYVSSLAAGGPAKEGMPLQEEDRAEPVSSYGKSKLEGEEALQECSPSFPSLIIRPPVVYGPRDKALLFILQSLEKGYDISFRRKGSNSYSFVHVEDLVQAILLAAFSEKTFSPGELFYVSGEEILSWQDTTRLLKKALAGEDRALRKISLPLALVKLIGEVLRLIELFTKKKMPFNRDKMREIVQAHWTCSNAKAKKILHFSPHWSLERGFEDLVDWYKNHGYL